MCSPICMFFTVVLLGFFVIVTISDNRQEKFEAYPFRIRFWNRDVVESTKYKAANIINWRKPNIHLSPEEYMMGSDLSKGNHCHHFVLDEESSRKDFCRCVYFFPELKQEYNDNFLKKTKIPIDKVCQ
jgi:hypothetical protein